MALHTLLACEFQQLNDGSWSVFMSENREINGDIVLGPTLSSTLSSNSYIDLNSTRIFMESADATSIEGSDPDDESNVKIKEMVKGVESSEEELYDSLESRGSYYTVTPTSEDAEDISEDDSERLCQTYTLQNGGFVQLEDDTDGLVNDWREVPLSGISGVREEMVQYYERGNEENNNEGCEIKDNVSCFGNEDNHPDNTPLQYQTESETELEQLSYSDKSSPRQRYAATSSLTDLTALVIASEEKCQTALPSSPMKQEQIVDVRTSPEQTSCERVDMNSTIDKKSSLLDKVQFDDDVMCEQIVKSLTPLIEFSEPEPEPIDKPKISFKHDKLNRRKLIISPIAVQCSSQFISQKRNRNRGSAVRNDRLGTESTTSDSTESFRRNELAMSSACPTPREFIPHSETKGEIVGEEEAQQQKEDETEIITPRSDGDIKKEDENLKLKSTPSHRPSKIPVIVNKLLTKTPSHLPVRFKIETESAPELKIDMKSPETQVVVNMLQLSPPRREFSEQFESSSDLVKHSPTTHLRNNDVPSLDLREEDEDEEEEEKEESSAPTSNIKPSEPEKQSWADCATRSKDQLSSRQNNQGKAIKNFIALNKAQLHRTPNKKSYTDIFLERKAKAEAKRKKEMEEDLGINLNSVEEDVIIPFCNAATEEVKTTDNFVVIESQVGSGTANELSAEEEESITYTSGRASDVKEESEEMATQQATGDAPLRRVLSDPQSEASLSTLSTGFIFSGGPGSVKGNSKVATTTKEKVTNDTEIKESSPRIAKLAGDLEQTQEEGEDKHSGINRCRKRKKRLHQKSIRQKEEEAKDSDKSSSPRQKPPKHKFTKGERSSSLPPLKRDDESKNINAFKPYTLKDYRQLQLDIHLGGLGPNSERNILHEKLQKYQRQANYAQQVMDRNRKLLETKLDKARTTYAQVIQDATELQKDTNRQRALDYAKNIRKRPTKLESNIKDENTESNSTLKGKVMNKHVKLPPLKSTNSGETNTTPQELQLDSNGGKSRTQSPVTTVRVEVSAGASGPMKSSHSAMDSVMENVEKLRERHVKEREIVEQLFNRKAEHDAKRKTSKKKKNNKD